jgi:hypothetical protein
MADPLSRYRASGADPPFGDPLPAHDVAMEGYFWRFTDPGGRRVVLALNGVNRAADGHWSTVGLAAHPGGFLRTFAEPWGEADPADLGARAGRGGGTDEETFRGTRDRLVVDLAPDARLQVRITDPVAWPRRRFGGSSFFQLLPRLNQYWHPWLLGGTAHGEATLGERTWEIDGWTAYAEKNWGRGGFPDSWWWGQAQGFHERSACVAFAGGEVTTGRLRTRVTALVVLLPDGRLVRLGDPLLSPVHSEVADEHWQLHGRGGQWTVEVSAHAPLSAAHVLPVPLPAERRNVPGAIEHLAGTMHVRVRRSGILCWEGESRLAGLEHGGLDRARAEVLRRGGSADDTEAAPRVR